MVFTNEDVKDFTAVTENREINMAMDFCKAHCAVNQNY
jgi:hypothetical protein